MYSGLHHLGDPIDRGLLSGSGRAAGFIGVSLPLGLRWGRSNLQLFGVSADVISVCLAFGDVWGEEWRLTPD